MGSNGKTLSRLSRVSRRNCRPHPTQGPPLHERKPMSNRTRTNRGSCPNCGRVELQLQRTDWPRRRWKCCSCGHAWSTVEITTDDQHAAHAIARRALAIVQEALDEAAERYP